MQADSYQPALKTIERLLALPGARALSDGRRITLESRAVACRLAQGDAQGALAHLRELLTLESRIDSAGLRARLWLQCSEALFRLTRLPESREHAERGLTLADAAADLSLAAQALNLLGRVAYREGDLARARDGYEQALALYRRLGDEANSAHVRNNLGLIHKTLCEWEAAETHLLAALELHRQSGRFAETAGPLLNLGIVRQKRGDWGQALEYYVRAEQVFVQVADDLRIPLVRIGARTSRACSAASTRPRACWATRSSAPA